jgi:hypothetical protein
LARTIVSFAFAVAALGCRGEVVTIGENPPPPSPTLHFGPPRLVVELAARARTDNATLTEDLLEIFFSSARDDNNFDIWTATRASREDTFGTPQKLRGMSSNRIDTGSAISADGLTLWIASDRRQSGGGGGGNNNSLDIWVSTRASRTAEWGDPALVPSLNSNSFDIPRPPGQHGLVMPLGTERGAGNVYRTYFATRSSETSPFETPEEQPELVIEKTTTMDAFLSDDGLTLYYAAGPLDEHVSAANDGGAPASDAGMAITSADLYVATRATTTEPFSGFAPITELNTAFDERDPWMSDDKTQFYFSYDRCGNMNIYTCDVIFK